MTSTPENMHLQLDELALQLLMLCQNLVDTKLLLEKFTKEGHINLAQSRYAMGGPSSVSGLQLPNENWEPFEADKTVKVSFCLRQEIGVKFNYLSLETEQNDPKKEKVETLGSELIHRGGGDKLSTTILQFPEIPETDVKEKITNQETEVNEKSAMKNKNPLKWFGLLVPNTLKQSQRHFSKAIELSVEATNVQSEIRGVLARRRVLLRQLKRLESTNEFSGVVREGAEEALAPPELMGSEKEEEEKKAKYALKYGTPNRNPSEDTESKEPAVVEESSKVEEPIKVEEPSKVEEQVKVEEPVIAEEPAKVEEPAIFEELPKVEKPVKVEEPVIAEEPAKVEEPEVVEELLKVEEPVKPQESNVESPQKPVEP